MQEIINKIILFLNIDDLSKLFIDTIYSIKGFFLYLFNNIPRIFGIYFVIIIIVFFFIIRTYKNFLSSRNLCLKEIDKILYKINLVVEKQKNDIHDFKNTVNILYNNQRKILTDKNLSFMLNFDDLLEDVRYIEKLLNIVIIKKQQVDKIYTLINITKKNRILYLSIINLFAIMTLGLGKLLQKDVKI